MGREIPSFLKEFMEMRKALSKQAPPAIVTAISPTGSVKRTPSKGTSDAVRQDMQERSLTTLIETKAPKKEVLDYFQRLCDTLTTQKMK